MSGAENQVAVQDAVFPGDANIDNLSDTVAKFSLQPDNSSSHSPESATDTSNRDDKHFLSPMLVTNGEPSQMGNFKHQSIRATDRDRDRDTDREQERDSRVKDGQERLWNSSDKYDRGRPALSSMQQLRGKDRDVASHLGATSSRLASQSQQAPSNRQVDSRQPSKKKDGETREDWRRDSTRTGCEVLIILGVIGMSVTDHSGVAIHRIQRLKFG
ncbi:hypothetical protein EDD22DRAFT_961908 [Suillus occidentalis]|nr:hypothetical protein EDD22DRAFT_961908 [Suillus occidentalis]